MNVFVLIKTQAQLKVMVAVYSRGPFYSMIYKKPQTDLNEAQCTNHLGTNLMTSDGLYELNKIFFS